jgi:hypothetical protein
MEVLLAIPILLVVFMFPIIAGCMAKSFGRGFWPWFLISIPLPLIPCFVLLCLPDKSKKASEPLKNEEFYSQLLVSDDVAASISGLIGR